jgi:ribosomal protein L37AE/L43A
MIYAQTPTTMFPERREMPAGPRVVAGNLVPASCPNCRANRMRWMFHRVWQCLSCGWEWED